MKTKRPLELRSTKSQTKLRRSKRRNSTAHILRCSWKLVKALNLELQCRLGAALSRARFLSRRKRERVRKRVLFSQRWSGSDIYLVYVTLSQLLNIMKTC